MPCIGILGVQIYHIELPKDLFDMIYKEQNFFDAKLNMDLFSHLKLSHYNTHQGRHAYKNLQLNIYTITYKGQELDFYLDDNTGGCIYIIHEAINPRQCIEYLNPMYFNEFLETLKDIGIHGREILDCGFFVLDK